MATMLNTSAMTAKVPKMTSHMSKSYCKFSFGMIRLFGKPLSERAYEELQASVLVADRRRAGSTAPTPNSSGVVRDTDDAADTQRLIVDNRAIYQRARAGGTLYPVSAFPMN